MTSASGFSAALARLGTVSLEEIDVAAELQTRRDRKYIVPERELDGLVARLGRQARVLEVGGALARPYESLYFDTAEFRSYLDAAHSRPQRSKIRIRTYVESDVCVLEVKARDQRGRTVKHRLPHDLAHRGEITPEGLRFIDLVDTANPRRGELQPTLTTRYHRATLLIDALLMDTLQSRVTIDTGVECESPDGRTVRIPGFVLIETKAQNHASIVDRDLWASGHRPLKVSKYCIGMAMLHPELPANKWHRILRTHFGRDGRLVSS